MGGQIVGDDDVARLQRGHQHLFDIGDEPIAIHRSLQDEGRRHATNAQGSGEGCRLPVAAAAQRIAVVALTPNRAAATRNE